MEVDKESIDLAYEILGKHAPTINMPHDDFDEQIEFVVVEAMFEFLKVMKEKNKI